jgi:uncharacterized SAM-binding protein YcdF (DUF218 family)
MVAGILFILVASLGGGFYAAGDYLSNSDDLQRSGAIVLLSGGDVERMDEAAKLMRERFAELLILTNTGRRMPDGMLEWQYARQEAISKGVSPAQIEPTDRVVDSTSSEAQAVREYLQRHSVSSCIVVTDPFHTRRTRIIFAREMANTGIDVIVVSPSGHWYRAESWFLSLRGWQSTLNEYIKLGMEFMQRY